MISSCTICFEAEDEERTKCLECNSTVCKGCMKEYLKIAKNDSTMIINCPNPVCRGEYLYDSFSNEKITKKYVDYLIKKIFNDKSFIAKITKNLRTQTVVSKIRNKRRDFIDGLPVCIKWMIENLYEKEYQKLLEVNKETIDRQMESGKIDCFSDKCKTGKLSLYGDFYECDSCSRNFCEKCEKRVKESEKESHVCNEDDVKSVNFKNSLPACPKCNAPIQKYTGCDAITCANCKTNFNYVSGKEFEFGNHETYNFKIRDEYGIETILDEYKDVKDFMKYYNKFAFIKPSIDYSPLEKYFSSLEWDKENDKIKMFKKYSQIKKKVKQAQKYTELQEKIYSLHLEGDLNKGSMKEIYLEMKEYIEKS